MFGRHVGKRAHRRCAGSPIDKRAVEIEEFGNPDRISGGFDDALLEQDVLRFQVKVRDALLMKFGQRVGDDGAVDPAIILRPELGVIARRR